MRALLYIPKTYPFRTQLFLACVKTWGADYIVQKAVEKREDIDIKRSLVFFVFGALYSGGLQYAIFINGFSRWFPASVRFASLSLPQKLRDVPGLKDLGKQISVHAAMSTFLYLPLYYVIKESIQGEKATTAMETIELGMSKYKANFWQDNITIQGFWCPMDVIIFGMLPMWARMPIQHTSALAWTMILSMLRGAAIPDEDPHPTHAQ